jgi:3-deoxy-D-manno-octulosonic-acid transferase
LLHIYSILFLSLFVILKCIALIVTSIRKQTTDRFAMLRYPISTGHHHRHTFFFCSSAGEYEQAKPLIDRLIAEQQSLPVAIFFSRSGYDYSQKKKEPCLCFLSPPDCIWFWRKIFKRFQPTTTLIVRHEFWPAFVTVAQTASKLIAIDISVSGSSSPWTSPKHFLTRRMLAQCCKIFTVTPEDASIVSRWRKSEKPGQCIAVGDTKFDRVLQRQRFAANERTRINEKIGGHLREGPRMAIGSGWPPDIELALASYEEFKDRWTLIIAPHDISRSMISLVENWCEARKLSFQLFSNEPQVNQTCQVLIVDTMGNLAEIYGCCSAAFVGGALHHQIHNVLEPACYGIPIAFGPKHLNSSEATTLARKGLAKVVHSPKDLSLWWTSLSKHDPAELQAFIDTMTGASQKIYSHMSQWNTSMETHFA